jgi:hypothetical protein
MLVMFLWRAAHVIAFVRPYRSQGRAVLCSWEIQHRQMQHLGPVSSDLLGPQLFHPQAQLGMIR